MGPVAGPRSIVLSVALIETEPLKFGEVVKPLPPKVAAVVVSEFEPSRDPHDRSLATLLWLLEYLLLRRYEEGCLTGQERGP